MEQRKKVTEVSKRHSVADKKAALGVVIRCVTCSPDQPYSPRDPGSFAG
ncbi:MAG: hypothetical protein ACRDKT_07830 [Actinomycetota bacterium]